MKNLKFLSFLMIVATSLLFIQCTTDPVPGEDGLDGMDGADGQDGATGTTECAACHNIATSEGVHSSYLYSGHAEGGAVGYAGKRNDCAHCHSNEGYLNYVMTGMPSETDFNNPTPVSCTTCHGNHTTFDFENDGFDYALRMPGPVTLMTDETYTINYENASNNCAFCHQPRTTPPVDNGNGMYAVTSSHWGPHHGPQSTFLEGIQGAEMAGSMNYPAPATGIHRTGSSCTECHMGESSGDIDGDHTWIATSTACTQCHPDGAPDGVAGLDDDMAALLIELEAVGILHEDDMGEVHPVVGEYSIEDAEAAWNYLLIMEDNSKGTHNPGYVKALMNNSLEVYSAE